MELNKIYPIVWDNKVWNAKLESEKIEKIGDKTKLTRVFLIDEIENKDNYTRVIIYETECSLECVGGGSYDIRDLHCLNYQEV
jgi:hypothetical protein